MGPSIKIHLILLIRTCGNKAFDLPIISRYAKEAHIANKMYLRKTFATGEDKSEDYGIPKIYRVL